LQIYILYVYIVLLYDLAGRYCEFKFKSYDRSSEMETFDAYLDSLKLSCENGNAGLLNWTVAEETPDLVYYQVKLLFVVSQFSILTLTLN